MKSTAKNMLVVFNANGGLVHKQFDNLGDAARYIAPRRNDGLACRTLTSGTIVFVGSIQAGKILLCGQYRNNLELLVTHDKIGLGNVTGFEICNQYSESGNYE